MILLSMQLCQCTACSCKKRVLLYCLLCRLCATAMWPITGWQLQSLV